MKYASLSLSLSLCGFHLLFPIRDPISDDPAASLPPLLFQRVRPPRGSIPLSSSMFHEQTPDKSTVCQKSIADPRCIQCHVNSYGHWIHRRSDVDFRQMALFSDVCTHELAGRIRDIRRVIINPSIHPSTQWCRFLRQELRETRRRERGNTRGCATKKARFSRNPAQEIYTTYLSLSLSLSLSLLSIHRGRLSYPYFRVLS